MTTNPIEIRRALMEISYADFRVGRHLTARGATYHLCTDRHQEREALPSR